MTKDIYCSQGEVATNILLASISTALHLGNGPVTGQVGFFGIITSQQSFHCFLVILFVHNGQVASWEYLFFLFASWLGVPFEKKSFVCIHYSLYQQGDQIEKIDKNPTVFVNPAQPLMASVEVSSTRFKNSSDKVWT